MFFGSYAHTLDSKGRLFLPSRMREQMGNRIYIMKGYEGCLSIYQESDFNAKMEQLQALPYNQISARENIRLELESVVELEIDDQGRITIPSKIIAKYAIEKKVTIIGILHHFEIWSTSAWEKYVQEREKNFEGNANSLPLNSK